MACRTAELADALVALLNAASFTADFTAARSWQPKEYLPGLDALQVNVAPRSRANSRLTRGADENRHAVEVSFLKRLTGSTEAARQAEIDANADLVEEVADYLARRQLTASAQAHSVLSVAIDPVAELTHLDEMLVFLSVVTVTYREVRAAS